MDAATLTSGHRKIVLRLYVEHVQKGEWSAAGQTGQVCSVSGLSGDEKKGVRVCCQFYGSAYQEAAGMKAGKTYECSGGYAKMRGSGSTGVGVLVDVAFDRGFVIA